MKKLASTIKKQKPHFGEVVLCLQMLLLSFHLQTVIAVIIRLAIRWFIKFSWPLFIYKDPEGGRLGSSWVTGFS